MRHPPDRATSARQEAQTDPTPLPGHALVTTRAVADLVREAASSSYGVVGFAGTGPASRIAALFGRGTPGVAVRIAPGLDVRLSLRVAFGVPIAQVASNVEAAVRYAIRHALGREVDSIVIHVDGLQVRRPARPDTGTTPE